MGLDWVALVDGLDWWRGIFIVVLGDFGVGFDVSAPSIPSSIGRVGTATSSPLQHLNSDDLPACGEVTRLRRVGGDSGGRIRIRVLEWPFCLEMDQADSLQANLPMDLTDQIEEARLKNPHLYRTILKLLQAA